MERSRSRSRSRARPLSPSRSRSRSRSASRERGGRILGRTWNIVLDGGPRSETAYFSSRYTRDAFMGALQDAFGDRYQWYLRRQRGPDSPDFIVFPNNAFKHGGDAALRQYLAEIDEADTPWMPIGEFLRDHVRATKQQILALGIVLPDAPPA